MTQIYLEENNNQTNMISVLVQGKSLIPVLITVDKRTIILTNKADVKSTNGILHPNSLLSLSSMYRVPISDKAWELCKYQYERKILGCKLHSLSDKKNNYPIVFTQPTSTLTEFNSDLFWYKIEPEDDGYHLTINGKTELHYNLDSVRDSIIKHTGYIPFYYKDEITSNAFNVKGSDIKINKHSYRHKYPVVISDKSTGKSIQKMVNLNFKKRIELIKEFIEVNRYEPYSLSDIILYKYMKDNCSTDLFNSVYNEKLIGAI